MMTSILTNTASMSALSLLSATQRSLQTTEGQVSSGLRVATASDNAAYWSIGVGMKSQVSTLGAVNDGLALTQSIVSVTSTAVKQIISIMQGLQADLVTSAEPGVDQGQIQADISAKQKLIIGIANSASFNGQNWLVQNKTADVQITENHHAQVTYSEMVAGTQQNFQARDPAPAFTGSIPYEFVGSRQPVPAGFTFDDDVDYTATALETDSAGNQKSETTTLSGVEIDHAYTDRGWIWSPDNPSDPKSALSWKPATRPYLDRQRAIPLVGNYSDVGNVNFSAVQTLAVPASSSSSGITSDSIDVTQFTLFTNYTGSTDVVEKKAYLGDPMTDGSIVYGDRSHHSTSSYSSYGVDNGFEENVGALDENLTGSDASTLRLSTPEDDLALGSKTTVLNFNVDGSDAHYAPGSSMMNTVNSDLASLTNMGAKLGSLSNQIETQSMFNSALSDAMTAGVGSLVDADLNVASTRLQALQTQQQLGIQSLSIANQNGQLVLKLFGATA